MTEKDVKKGFRSLFKRKKDKITDDKREESNPLFSENKQEPEDIIKNEYLNRNITDNSNNSHKYKKKDNNKSVFKIPSAEDEKTIIPVQSGSDKSEEKIQSDISLEEILRKIRTDEQNNSESGEHEIAKISEEKTDESSQKGMDKLNELNELIDSYYSEEDGNKNIDKYPREVGELQVKYSAGKSREISENKCELPDEKPDEPDNERNTALTASEKSSRTYGEVQEYNSEIIQEAEKYTRQAPETADAEKAEDDIRKTDLEIKNKESGTDLKKETSVNQENSVGLSDKKRDSIILTGNYQKEKPTIEETKTDNSGSKTEIKRTDTEKDPDRINEYKEPEDKNPAETMDEAREKERFSPQQTEISPEEFKNLIGNLDTEKLTGSVKEQYSIPKITEDKSGEGQNENSVIINENNLNPKQEEEVSKEEEEQKKEKIAKLTEDSDTIKKTYIMGENEENNFKTSKKTRWSQSGTGYQSEKYEESEEDFSDLILPEGATFEVEDFHIKSKEKTFLPEEKEKILSRIDNIYDKNFPDEKETVSEKFKVIKKKKEKKEKTAGKKLFSGFKKEKAVLQEEYNPSVHGSIVDLSFNGEEGLEEVELYPVNEPYAYIRIVYDKNTNEYLYEVIEPQLNDAEEELFGEIKQRLFEILDVNTKDLSKKESYEILKSSVSEIISDYGIKMDPASGARIMYKIYKEFLGDGLIDPVMHDKFIEDISCDGLNTPIFVYHSNYESMQTNLSYEKNINLDSFVTRLAQRAGKYISIAEPMLDATMSDGSRIQMTLGTEVTAHGSTFTIRKFKEEPITPTDLIEWGTFSPLSIAYIWLAVEGGKSCIFAGGTASGKTTSLNAISLFIPPLAKIVTLEDTRELKLPHKNWIPSITRESFDNEGKGSIDMYELLRAALRQRPEYILVGEVRGHEALTLFQAMSTGHITYATMHADSVASVVHRLENPPLNVPRNMLNALDLVSVQVQSRVGGQRIRRNKQLIEILDIDPRTRELITNDVFKWYAATDEIRYSGKSYILEEIMEERGWSDERMREELKRRQEILEWMRIKKLRNYKDVGKVLMSYYRDPDAIMTLVRADLYE